MTLAVDGMKCCASCKETKSVSEYVRDASRADGLLSYCRSCKADRAKPDYNKRYEEYGRTWHYKTKYGITPDKYAGLLLLQGGVCAICPSDGGKRKLVVDHDHETGQVRGLLCHNCNSAIGLLKEDTSVLEAAIAYLKKGSEE